MSLWTIIPIRGLASGKSRLAATLDEEERVALNEWLLRHVLEAVSASQASLDRCIVVSPSEDALALATSLGARTVEEAAGAGLNEAVGLAAGMATARGATRALILVSDLPYVSKAAIDGLLQAAQNSDWIVLAADHLSRGTNAIVLTVPSQFRFRFGPSSLAKHREEAIRIGAGVVVHRDQNLARDLDTAEDLARWQASLSNTR